MSSPKDSDPLPIRKEADNLAFQQWQRVIDQVKSMRELDDVESVIGSHPMSFETLDLMNPEFKKTNQLAEEMQEKKGLPMLTGRPVAFIIYAWTCLLHEAHVRDLKRHARQELFADVCGCNGQ